MKLSELVYLVVKNVKYMEDDSFVYDNFITGAYNQDPDYANSINNAFTPINEAIHRLSDLRKLPYIIANLAFVNGAYKIPTLEHKVKKVVSVFYIKQGIPTKVQFKQYGKNDIAIYGIFSVGTIFKCQYIEDIKTFSSKDIVYSFEEETLITDYDLEDFGIDETMCSYIIEYTQGKLLEPIAPEMARVHINNAEQYFTNLEDKQEVIEQEQIERVNRI